MNKKYLLITTLASIAVVFFIAVGQTYLQPTPFDLTTSTSDKKQPDLKATIEALAEEYKIAPVDAYIDSVWKKTAGRNGRKVNIDKSYKKMKKANKFDEHLLVFDEIPPEVSLTDLAVAPIFRGNPHKDMVALLINVSWGTEHIPEILQALDKQQVKATFFIEGKWAKENIESVKMIHEQNHLIGNHAYNHPDMANLSKLEMQEQIDKTNDIIEAIIGERPKWFAPPSGSFNQEVVQVAADLQMETILWTVDTIDWKKPSVSVMINRVMTKVHPGATILMHPTDPVAQGLEELIKEIKSKNLDLGTIEVLLDEQR